jgi:hypothetical protein
MTPLPFWPLFVLCYLLGRILSTTLYQITWNSGLQRKFHSWGALATLLGRPWPWLLHLPVLALSATMNWQDLPKVHVYASIGAGCLSLAAIGRWGAFDLRRLFLFDRLLIGVLCVGVWVSPVFLYPLVLACCCLQYTVSGWPQNPGYSNLLGYEFMRSSLCMVLAALMVDAALDLANIRVLGIYQMDALFIGLVLCSQSSGYVLQALAKSALGKHWYSWILENRLQCLFVNAHLRGWGASRMQTKTVVKLARSISRIRVPLCGAAWFIEMSWLLVLANPRIAFAILAATAAFHLVVWLTTGLVSYHYVVSHFTMMFLLASPWAFPLFQAQWAMVGACCVGLSSVWVLLLRRHLYNEYTSKGEAGPWSRVVDPSDHLMSWWDGPYMRMYSYRVKTSSGRLFSFPVTRFAPYDTFLTDIHTHLMILGKDWELDTRLQADRAIARTGVWGLTVSLEHRDRLYALMENSQADLESLKPPPTMDRIDQATPLIDDKGSRQLSSLEAFFKGLNQYQARWWFPILWRWPHFPGEDLVPDWSPLAREQYPAYRGTEPVTELTLLCVKTFFRGDTVQVLEERHVARLPL